LCEGAAVAVATEEAFVRGNAQIVEQWVAEQPPWSDFPFVVLTGRASSATAHVYRLRLLERLGNVSLLERPLNAVTLASTVKAALRARYRQYEVRDHLFERDLAKPTAEPFRTGRLHGGGERRVPSWPLTPWRAGSCAFLFGCFLFGRFGR
jgi:hypothetical protein